jgi:hypothetical protein
MGIAYKVLVGKCGRIIYRWDDNIKIDLREIDRGGVWHLVSFVLMCQWPSSCWCKIPSLLTPVVFLFTGKRIWII